MSTGPEFFGLGRSGNCVRFAARFLGRGGSEVASASRPTPSCGDFVEGLWEADVAEFFVADPASGRYLEFNLSPLAAWWAGAFDAPRQRSPSFVPPPVSASLTGEVAEIWVDWRGVDFPLESARVNVTAIISGDHFSWAQLNPPQPDFHRPQDFVPIACI